MSLLANYPLSFRWGVISASTNPAIAKFRHDFVLAYGVSPVVADNRIDFSSGEYAWFGDSPERVQAKRCQVPFVAMDFNSVVESQLTTASPSKGAAKRIVLVGGESTGKTTLAQQLAQHYKTLWVPEYCRLFLEHKDRGVLPEDQLPIVCGQYALQRAMSPLAGGLLIADTDLLMTMIYSEHFYGIPPSSMAHLFTPQKEDCYLLLEPDLPWQADRFRDSPQDREKIHDDVKKLSVKYGLRPHDLRGIGPARFHSAVKIIDAALNIY